MEYWGQVSDCKDVKENEVKKRKHLGMNGEIETNQHLPATQCGVEKCSKMEVQMDLCKRGEEAVHGGSE